MTNSAFANGTFNGTQVTSNTASTTVTAKRPSFTIVYLPITVYEPEYAFIPGDVIRCRAQVTNDGNVGLTGVSVNYPMVTLTGPIGDDNDPGVLDPEETWEYTGNYTLTQDDIKNKKYINNTATVISNELPEKNSTGSQQINKKSNLQIQLSRVGIDEAGNKIIYEPGDIINYKVTVKNTGNMNLTGGICK